MTGEISGIVVVDCESAEDARWFWDNCGRTNVIVKTKRGYHLYFKHPGTRVRNAIKANGRYDVRGDGGYVVAPPSKHSEGYYSWSQPLKNVSNLPVFNLQWRPNNDQTDFSEKVIRDGQRYIQHIHAVAGQNGHDDTFRAANILRESGLDRLEAYIVMQDWNSTNASPPWSEKDLLRKVREAYK